MSEESGICPTCNGMATIYRNPENSLRGHVYCEEDDCGWVHRDVNGVSRYVQ